MKLDENSTYDTATLQNEIDECSRNGGGRVSIPKGIHTVGSILLKSNVDLHLEKGAVLRGSSNFNDYPSFSGGFKDAVGHLRSRCLVFASKAENISISGAGEIDGNGGVFGTAHPEHVKRPFLIRLIDCENIRISGVSLKNSAAWVCHIQRSNQIELSNLTIYSHCNHNNDGMDIDSCSHVTISECNIDTSDDALCFKTTSSIPCENITVENCRLKSDCGALKFGTESYGDFRNINVSNCEIHDTLLGAIKFCAMDGGIMEDIQISNVTIRNSTGPFFFRLGDRKNVYMEDVPKEVGRIRNIRLEDIHVDVMDRGKQHSGALITGVPHQMIENIKCHNISITYPGGGDAEDALNCPDEQIAEYPEASYFGVLPSYAFFIRHARNIEMKNVEVTIQKPDHRCALKTVNVQDSQLQLTELNGLHSCAELSRMASV